MSNVSPGPSLRGAVDLSALVKRANAPQQEPGTARATSPDDGALVFEVDDAGFQRVLELSASVPVVIEFYAAGLQPALGPIVESYGGRVLLATVDAQVNPQLAQAFQVREVPAVAAVVAGRPVNLFLGIPSDAEIRQVLDELLQLAVQNGVAGAVPGDDATAMPPEPAEEPLPPHHQEAFDAISVGNFAAAITAYQTAIQQNPRDDLAVAGLAQVKLLQRLDGTVADELRRVAADQPTDVGAQLAVADLDLSGGHLDDAFDRLLDLFPGLDPAGKNEVRTRLLDFFEIAGADEPRVIAARRRLTALLY